MFFGKILERVHDRILEIPGRTTGGTHGETSRGLPGEIHGEMLGAILESFREILERNLIKTSEFL